MASEEIKWKGNLFSLLDDWVALGWMRPLDRAFVHFLSERAPQSPEPALLAAALVSHQLGRGHVCLDLKSTLDHPNETLSLPPEGEMDGPMGIAPSAILNGISLQSWEQCLHDSPLTSTGDGNSPLVLDAGRLYLRRFWKYTRQVAQSITDRLQNLHPTPENLVDRLDRHFAPFRDSLERKKKEVHWQSVAAAIAVRHSFCVISGGPGTGKTTTVVHLIALLQELALENGKKLRIRLAAPTGKAAARLTESIGQAVGNLPENLGKAIPFEVTTLHRLLGSRPDTRHFAFTSKHPLHVDLMVVDEASMVDIEMMASLLDALPANARLILLGDKDQLASVEAGSVLGDICRRANASGYTSETAAWIEKNTGYSVPVAVDHISALDAHIALLHKSYRFHDKSGIGALARAVNSGEPQQVTAIWEKGFGDIVQLQLSEDDNRRFAQLVLDGSTLDDAGEKRSVPSVGYRAYLDRLQQGYGNAIPEELWLLNILNDFSRFRLVSAMRKGIWGVKGLNERVAEVLFRENLIKETDGWYAGRPVMVTRNDYRLGLMNGDTGILLPVNDDPEKGKKTWKVVFHMADGSLKKVAPSRLNDVETAYAMTVHKSQGSEFDHTALAFPDHLSPLLTRELIYTAITRSRSRFTLVSPNVNLMADCVTRRIHRASGLQKLLDR